MKKSELLLKSVFLFIFLGSLFSLSVSKEGIDKLSSCMLMYERLNTTSS